MDQASIAGLAVLLSRLGCTLEGARATATAGTASPRGMKAIGTGLVGARHNKRLKKQMRLRSTPGILFASVIK